MEYSNSQKQTQTLDGYNVSRVKERSAAAAHFWPRKIVGLGLDVPPSSLGGVFVNAVARAHDISFSNYAYDYRKVASSYTARFEAHADFFRLLKYEGDFDPGNVLPSRRNPHNIYISVQLWES